MRRRAIEPVIPIGSDLTNTIRARGQRGLHQEAGHTTVPDQAATDSVLKPGLPTRGRPHTTHADHRFRGIPITLE